MLAFLATNMSSLYLNFKLENVTLFLFFFSYHIIVQWNQTFSLSQLWLYSFSQRGPQSEINTFWSIDDHEYSSLSWPRKTAGEERSGARREEADGMEVEMDGLPRMKEDKMRRESGASVRLWWMLMSQKYSCIQFWVCFTVWIHVQVSISIKLSALPLIHSVYFY